jgi:UDP-N-acetylmuramoyl-L-alanyl-D-glutamate--2,6-diaminopimelate ligase
LTSTRTNSTLGELLQRAGVRPAAVSGDDRVNVVALTDDSRRVGAGSCFVAVKGTAVDGHRFVDRAVAAGASALVVERPVPASGPATVVQVADSRDALARLAAAHHRLRRDDGRYALPLVGITGTNGKTTTAFLLRSLLNASGRRCALFGTVESDLIGRRSPSPLTTPGAVELSADLREALDAGATHAVLEVSSHALDQRRCDGLTFAVGVFTNLTGDHLDYHKTLEHYAGAKRRLFSLLEAGGVAVVNADDAWSELMASAFPGRVIRFGLDTRQAELRAEQVSQSAGGMRFIVRGPGYRMPVACGLVGLHNVRNVLAAVAAAEALGLTFDEIAAGVASLAGAPGRLERVEPAGSPYSVFVDYAHSDDALQNVLGAVRPITPGRLICVFGCGGDRDRTKRPRMAAAVARFADTAVVTSDNPRSEDPQAIIDEVLPGFAGASCRVEIQPDRRAAIELALHGAGPGDTVLIAGKGHEDYQIIGDRTLPFDDRAVAREFFSRQHGCARGTV